MIVMMFQKKLDRAMDWIKNSNEDNEQDRTTLELEKMDIPAIIISALLVFSPIFLILILILLSGCIATKDGDTLTV